jgi:ABC-type uncharacterized transport system substrate-binding protein
MSGNCEPDGIRRSGGEHPLTCPVTCCFVSWLIGCKPTGWVTLPLAGLFDLGPKRLQILREVIAKVTRVVYLANPDNASNMAALAETNIAASAAGTVLILVEVRVVGDFDPAFAAIMRERPDAILVSNDAFHQLHIGRIIEFLAKNRLPGMFQSKES